MKDDIETLRRLADGLGTGERKEAMAALESVENVLGQKFIDNEIERMQRYGADTLAGIMARATVAETERDSLRAKLEKAKKVLLRTRELVSSCAMEGFNVTSSPIDELFSNNGKISAVLSELSADAPVQPPQLCPVHGKPFPCCVDFDPTAPAQPPQISEDVHALLDEAIAALEPFSEAATNLDDAFTDTSDIWEHSSAMSLTGGDLRRARAILTKLRAARNG